MVLHGIFSSLSLVKLTSVGTPGFPWSVPAKNGSVFPYWDEPRDASETSGLAAIGSSGISTSPENRGMDEVSEFHEFHESGDPMEGQGESSAGRAFLRPHRLQKNLPREERKLGFFGFSGCRAASLPRLSRLNVGSVEDPCVVLGHS